MAPTLPTFGKPSNEWTRGESGGNAGGNQGEFFIKTFKEDRTAPIQFLWDDPNTFVKWAEHFDKGNRISYPCAKAVGEDACIGCDYPTEDPDNEKLPGTQVRQVSWQWGFPAIDPKGYVSLYKIGVKFWDDLKVTAAEYGGLADKSFAVVKTWNENRDWNSVKTTAKILIGVENRAPRTGVPTAAQFQQLLVKKYVEAAQKYGYTDIVGGTVEEPTDGSTASGYDPAPADDTAPADEAQATHAPDPVPAERPGDMASEALAARKNAADAPPAEPDAAPDFTVMETPDLKTWLESNDVEFSSKAPRSVLIGLATKRLAALANA